MIAWPLLLSAATSLARLGDGVVKDVGGAMLPNQSMVPEEIGSLLRSPVETHNLDAAVDFFNKLKPRAQRA